MGCGEVRWDGVGWDGMGWGEVGLGEVGWGERCGVAVCRVERKEWSGVGWDTSVIRFTSGFSCGIHSYIYIYKMEVVMLTLS